MDGYTATKKIRESRDHAWSRIPIVAMTANAMQEDRQKCIEVGMDDYVSKPAKYEDLVSAIERAMKKSGRSAA